MNFGALILWLLFIIPWKASDFIAASWSFFIFGVLSRQVGCTWTAISKAAASVKSPAEYGFPVDDFLKYGVELVCNFSRYCNCFSYAPSAANSSKNKHMKHEIYYCDFNNLQ